jgi:pyridoxal phosphate enzyme (YggS family)
VGDIADNLKRVQERVARSSEQSGRPPDAVTLVVVTKTHPIDRIQEALDAGARSLGENRVQEAQDKVAPIRSSLIESDPVKWHLVGHLQRNKVKPALEIFDLIQSVDSLRLAKEIGKRAVQMQKTVRVLAQVSTSGADTQYGLEPETTPEFIGQLSEIAGLEVQGLMTIGEFLPNPEDVRPCFVRLRELRDRIADQKIAAVSLDHLSMGMTSDFEVAIQEGATIVRVGTAVFGRRQ